MALIKKITFGLGCLIILIALAILGDWPDEVNEV